ncbi:hypothetical protein [Tardiphaga sp.]|uniref:hypothetical protein n=1 Tax=Tardiphaga sp. TaxID=1926292 RepID=UPI0025CBDE2C|nr:hypothetical protein [Tardiphaga sp.]
MTTEISHADLEQALSLERFGRYLAWADGDRGRALELYTLNSLISESLYIPLQMLEVALRNKVHAVMTEALHDGWFHDDGLLLGDRQPDQIAAAIDDITRDGRDATPGRIVAEVTFSFWTAMFGTPYDELWKTTLHRVARKPNGKGVLRKDFAGPLTPIRILRNRIAHHEPIIAWNLAKHHGKMVELTEWLSPAAAAWCRQHDRFDQVYPKDRISLAVIPKAEE